MAEIINNRAESRYELQEGGELAFAAYEQRGDVIIFTHTIVPRALEGRGIASQLISHALDDVRAQGLKIDPQCGFVAAYLNRHPKERDLLASGAG
ncbi:N-acetyltransferase [Sphingomonas sp. So64.6b]|uniref:GNAT family N-acetyltransferase n=1 Tax=Sphingomonas sp. So64.6b TaxID=2997354 RepID=UPI00160051A1|nr:GNAT family N-acetyltransferase [Sphingomonas sp. So64.6b]QNA85879.1 N-acetyltransferase [Sphingomonas sp. So64.6b]